MLDTVSSESPRRAESTEVLLQLQFIHYMLGVEFDARINSRVFG